MNRAEDRLKEAMAEAIVGVVRQAIRDAFIVGYGAGMRRAPKDGLWTERDIARMHEIADEYMEER